MMYSSNPSSVLNGTQLRRRCRRRCECFTLLKCRPYSHKYVIFCLKGSTQNFHPHHQSALNPRVNQLRGERSSERNPPPPYPGPSNEAPPPPYWTLRGPRLPYYEPPPPYYEPPPPYYEPPPPYYPQTPTRSISRNDFSKPPPPYVLRDRTVATSATSACTVSGIKALSTWDLLQLGFQHRLQCRLI
ncbi:hypothetical protein SFRURICE_010489 [Spodoptera frugiperda]|nr:hypothetical protein SFRURICE_010489 [Spodoptera frugiperda]